MATLEKIRSKAALLVVVVGVALFAFIIGDFLRSGSTFFQQSKEKVIVVDGNSISIQDYQSRVEYLSNMYKGSGNLSEDQQFQIREMVFQEKVNTILLKEIGEKVGLSVGTEELSDMVLGNNTSPLILQIPDFQNPQTGQFDKNSFIQFLQLVETDDIGMYPAESQQQILNMKQYWADMEKNIVNDKLRSKLTSLIVNGITNNSLDAKKHFEETAVNVDFEFVTQPFSIVPDSAITVSNSEISKLYEERKEYFKQEEARVIDYIAINIVPSQEDYNDVAEQLEKVKQEFSTTTDVVDVVNDNSDVPFLNAFGSITEFPGDVAQFLQSEEIGSIYGPVLTENTYNLYKLIDKTQAPDSIFVYFLSLPAFNDEVKLKNFSDSLINVLKEKSFSEMAIEATGGQGNGEMGWQTEYSLAKNGADIQMTEAMFSAKLNTPQVIKSTFGSHLFQVTEKTKSVAKYKVADISIVVTPSTETYNQMYNDLNQFISTNNDVVSFRKNASDAGFFPQVDMSVIANQNRLANIGNSRQVVRWAFSNKKGSVSDIFECDDYFVAATVIGYKKEGYLSMEEVSAVLKRELMSKKKGEKIVNDLNAKKLSSLEQYADATGTTVQGTQFVNFDTPRITGIGMDPVVNAKAVFAEVGTITGPFTGNNAVYVLSLTNKNTENQTFDETISKSQLQMQNSYRFGQAIQSGALLQENATIEDNRLRFH